MSKPKTVTLEQVRTQRPTDEAAVAGRRDEILVESRANRLADLRRGARLTQEQLADRIGVDQPRVSRIERGDLARTETGSKESSPAEPSPGIKAAQKAVKKAVKPKTACASGSTGRKRLAG